MINPTTDSLVHSHSGDPALLPGNAYRRYPERADWIESEIYERPDGSRYTRTREVLRWNGVYAVGEWKVSK